MLRRGKCIERLAFSNPAWAAPALRNWDVVLGGAIVRGVITASP